MALQQPIVFELAGVTRVYRVGNSEIHALRGVDLQLLAGEPPETVAAP